MSWIQIFMSSTILNSNSTQPESIELKLNSTHEFELSLSWMSIFCPHWQQQECNKGSSENVGMRAHQWEHGNRRAEMTAWQEMTRDGNRRAEMRVGQWEVIRGQQGQHWECSNENAVTRAQQWEGSGTSMAMRAWQLESSNESIVMRMQQWEHSNGPPGGAARAAARPWQEFGNRSAVMRAWHQMRSNESAVIRA